METNDDSEIFDGFDPMAEDYVKTLNSNYFGGPGFALPDVQNGTKPLNILVENIPEDLRREGLIRAFKLANVFPITCKLFPLKGSNKAILHVRSITDATTAIQALNNQPPLNLKVTLAANQEDFEVKRNQIQREQRLELAKHLRALAKPLNKMGELVNNLCAVENLFKILSTRDEMCQVCTAEPLIRHVHFIVSEEMVIDPFQDLPQSLPVSCSYCSTKDGKFVVCSKCRVTSYCGLRCQSLDWFCHRESCSPHLKLTNGDSHHSPDESNVINKLTEIKEPPSPKVQVTLKDNKVKESQDVKTNRITAKPFEEQPTVKPAEIHPELKKNEEKVQEISPSVKLPAPSKNLTVTDDSDYKVKPNIHHNQINNFTNFIQEPNKIIKPRIKISLNNEVSNIRETKLDINAITEIVFSYCYSPSEFYVQRLVDTSEAEAITEKLFQVCAKAKDWPEANKLKPGNYCACLFKQDGFWYRAKVLGFQDAKVEVKFIDYGNRDMVDFTDLRPLPPELVAIPALAVNCALKYVKPLFESGWNKEASKFFEDCLSGEVEYPYNNCKVLNDFDGVHQVELINENGEKLNDLLVQKGLAKHYEEYRKPLQPRIRRNPDLSSSPPQIEFGVNCGGVGNRSPKDNFDERNEIRIENGLAKSKPQVIEPVQPKSNPVVDVSPPRPQPIKELSPGEAYKRNCLQKTPASYYHLYNMGSIKEDEAVLLYNEIDDPSVVFILGNNGSMLKLCNELGDIEQKSEHINPKPGLLAVAPADDGDFYRVLVMDVEGDKSRVFYLDFGNQDLVDNSDILKLPEKIGLDKIPAQGIRCRIDNMVKIENYESRLADRIANGTPAEIKVVRKISDHEYAIELTL